ncbi:MAG: hypothetical protein JNL28_06320 [Planctomycetes bacterium]|nr:hypothetical protein [Planctomycetota bacterium]
MTRKVHVLGRALFVTAVWAALIVLIACVAHFAGPEPVVQSSAGVAERTAHAVVPAPPRPIVAPPAPETSRKPPQVPTQPASKGGVGEGGMLGLGSLPLGPGAAYQGLGVQVISHATTEPIAGALVRWATADQLAEWSRAHHGMPPELVDPAVVLDLCTTPVPTQSGGIAITESAPGKMLVDARSGVLYGFAWVDRDVQARTRIDVVADGTLAVEVVDFATQPVGGVTVLVRDSSGVDLWSATSAQDGLAYWPHAPFVIARDATPGVCTVMLERVTDGWWRKSAQITVESFAGSKDSTGHATTAGRDPIRLVAGAVGRVEVELFTESGQRVDELVTVSLRTAADAGGAGAVRRATRSAHAVFEVEPGLDLVLDIDGHDSFESRSQNLRGPEKANETSTIRAVVGPRLPVVRARLVGEGAEPLRTVKGAAWIETGAPTGQHPTAGRVEFETDDAGQVRIVLHPLPEQAQIAALLIVTRNKFGDWFSAVHVPLADARRDTDLGDLTLAEMPTVVAGYVLNEREWPVPNAQVEIATSDDPTLDPDLFQPDLRFTAVADQVGYFRLRGLVEGARIALTVSAPDHTRPKRRVVERGDRKLALAIERCASIAGKLILPGGMPPDPVHVWIDLEYESIPARIGPDLVYRCVGIPRGDFDLRVMVDGLPEPAYLVQNMSALPGVDQRDPGTTTVNLQQRLGWFACSVRSSDERVALTGVALVTETHDSGPVVREVPFQKGLLEFPAATKVVDIEVRVEGYETRLLLQVDHCPDIHLSPLKR